MIRSSFKNLAARMPGSWQLEMKRHLYRRQIRRDSFVTYEPEFAILDSLVSAGDWAIDVGANIGHYTKRMSDIVGEHGRIIAFEPIGETFSLLAGNVRNFKFQNVTLLNAAASDKSAIAGMSIPHYENGMRNFYEASITTNGEGLQAMTLAIDSLSLPSSVSLVKIDAEGHELNVLRGMSQLLERDKPFLIIEVSSREVDLFLEPRGYSRETLPNSPNHIYRP
jgi:FkbM family methyltransferase